MRAFTTVNSALKNLKSMYPRHFLAMCFGSVRHTVFKTSLSLWASLAHLQPRTVSAVLAMFLRFLVLKQLLQECIGVKTLIPTLYGVTYSVFTFSIHWSDQPEKIGFFKNLNILGLLKKYILFYFWCF